MGLFGSGPDAQLIIEVLVYQPLPSEQGVPCFARGGGAAELVPYAPGAYLDKILSNLTHDRFGAARLTERVADHVATIGKAWDPESDDLAHAFEEHALSDRVSLIAEERTTEPKPGRIRADVWCNMKRERLGAVTHFKGRTGNPESAEVGFWAVWNHCCVTARDREGWPSVAKQVGAMAAQLSIYDEVGQTPGMREMAKAPFQVMYAFESNEAESRASGGQG